MAQQGAAAYEGWLTKRSVWLKEWRRRYFRLIDNKSVGLATCSADWTGPPAAAASDRNHRRPAPPLLIAAHPRLYFSKTPGDEPHGVIDLAQCLTVRGCSCGFAAASHTQHGACTPVLAMRPALQSRAAGGVAALLPAGIAAAPILYGAGASSTRGGGGHGAGVSACLLWGVASMSWRIELPARTALCVLGRGGGGAVPLRGMRLPPLELLLCAGDHLPRI
jgi:hypothetical protein